MSSSRSVKMGARSANELILNQMYPVTYISSRTTAAMKKMTTTSVPLI